MSSRRVSTSSDQIVGLRADRRVSRPNDDAAPRPARARTAVTVLPAALALCGALLLAGPPGGHDGDTSVEVADHATGAAFGFGWLDVPALSPIPGDPSGHAGRGAAIAMCAIGLAGTATAVASSRRR